MATADPKAIDAILRRLESLENELAATKAELERKNQIIEALKQRIYGSSSEKMDPAQLQLAFDEILLGKCEAPPETGDETSAPEEPNEKSGKRNRRKKRDLFPANMKIVIDSIIIPEEVAADPDKWKKIGEEKQDELTITRAEMYWRRTIREKYIRIDDRSHPPVIAPAPEPSIAGTHCSPELAATIIVDKFCDHLPYYRQSERIKREHGIILRDSTLTAWAHATATHLTPIGQAIRAELLIAPVLQVDETTINYLSPGNGKTKKGFLWVSLDPQGNTVYYDWQTGRSYECLLQALGYDPKTGKIKFRGTLQCDGYIVYETLAAHYPEILLAACLAHIRRKFKEAGEQSPAATIPILKKIQQLYQIEKGMRQSKAPPDCRELIRRANSRPIVEELKHHIDQEKTKHLPQSKLGEAINYALNQWEQFERYLKDGRIEIDNNLVENSIRGTKLGAKNWLFFGNAEAGKNNALMYTLIENCKRQGLNPEDYLVEVIRRLPANATPDQAADLTPAKIAAAQAAAADAKIENTNAA